MSIRAATCFLAVTFAWLLPAAAQNPNAEVVATPVTDNIHMLEGSGGNVGLCVGPDGSFLVDDQYAVMSDKIAAAVAKISPQAIRFVINTHWHPDHSGGNETFGSAGAVIVAHENVRQRLSTDQLIKAFLMPVPASPPAALPIVTFAEEVTFHLNGHTVRVIHVEPAHTDGDSVIKFEEANVLHTGDVFFNKMYPFLDESSGGSLAGMVRGANRALELCDEETKIIPGHGALATRSDLVAFRDMLATVLERLEGFVAEGKGIAEIIAAKPTAEFDAEWGGGFLKPSHWLRIVTPTVKPPEQRESH